MDDPADEALPFDEPAADEALLFDDAALDLELAALEADDFEEAAEDADERWDMSFNRWRRVVENRPFTNTTKC